MDLDDYKFGGWHEYARPGRAPPARICKSVAAESGHGFATDTIGIGRMARRKERWKSLMWAQAIDAGGRDAASRRGEARFTRARSLERREGDALRGTMTHFRERDSA